MKLVFTAEMQTPRQTRRCREIISLSRLVYYTFCVVNSLALDISAAPSKRQITYDDLAPDGRALLDPALLSPDGFDRHVASITQQTRQRQTEGENDHLVYFVLQSQRFTAEPKIEPALSAYELVNSLDRGTRTRYLSEPGFAPPAGKIPRRVARRIEDFLRALEKPVGDGRLIYFKTWMRQSAQPGVSSRDYVRAQYARAMRFLYEKDFLARDSASATAALYQTRGHSTDTQIEANYAIHVALAILRAQNGGRQLHNVLIVGPGLDFAPRTDLLDVFEPQSYQPFAVADSLLGLKLADRRLLHIHSVDINHRVTDYLRRFPAAENKTLAVLSGIADTRRQPLTADYKEFFENFGSNIGSPARLIALPENYKEHLRKAVAVNDEAARMMSADELNIVTERYDPSPRYDLVIATNVLSYFKDAELLLALANIKAMMNANGYLIHNESRDVLATFSEKLKLPVLHSRTVSFSGAGSQPLYDRVYVHKYSDE